ncbi:RNAse (barnase) inhibitor barstar [Lentzea atacamensis]|uniref:RNAse (Barnase) inhibitor barstar n=2 Tax=Lentzea atacamensis TaxID=531938 RepID=A0A316HVC7_9PSEU|nr:barstar family protein [Lentzea atacamensis]PWK82281.1 RNAse (barnase) inhibitor barstar [Lentzea atacamensis]
MFRYEVVHWYEDDHDEIVEVLARAVDTDGLFARPRPGDRERVVLRGCPPSFAGLTGNCMLEIGTDDEWQWWSLEDLVVHGTVPDGDLIDVVASAEVRLVDDGPGLGPCCNLSTAGARVGGCRGVDGFPRQWEGLDWPPVALIGVDHPERIRPLDRRKHSWAGGERLHALDRHGHVMAKVPIDLDVASVTPSALGDGLFDVVLDQSDSEERPDPSARAVWDLWREGVPAERNLWAPFDTAGRQAWSRLTLQRLEKSAADQVGGVYHLDGRHVTDEPGLHLAMSEALLGPGHYFGWGYDALADCLCGGFGVRPPFTLVWNDAQVAHGAIRDHFLLVLELMRRSGITVELKSPSTLDGVTGLDRRLAFGALVTSWVAGYTKAADLSAEPFADSWIVRGDQQDRQVERVVTDEAGTDWHVGKMWKGDWITVPTTAPDEMTARLMDAGLEMRPRETFMRRSLTDHPAPEPPAGYTIEVSREDVVIDVRLLFEGTEAASGRMAVVDSDAVPHRVFTTPAHRRQGLGSVVMGVLAREAAAAGAVDGLLFATADGLPLYRKLGWEIVSDVVIASNTKGKHDR